MTRLGHWLADLYAEIVRLLLRWRHGACPETSWGLRQPCIYHFGHRLHAAGGHETATGTTWEEERPWTVDAGS